MPCVATRGWREEKQRREPSRKRRLFSVYGFRGKRNEFGARYRVLGAEPRFP